MRGVFCQAHFQRRRLAGEAMAVAVMSELGWTYCKKALVTLPAAVRLAANYPQIASFGESLVRIRSSPSG